MRPRNRKKNKITMLLFFIFRIKFVRNSKIILILFIPFIGLLLKFLIPVSKELLIPNICRQMKYLKSPPPLPPHQRISLSGSACSSFLKASPNTGLRLEELCRISYEHTWELRAAPVKTWRVLHGCLKMRFIHKGLSWLAVEMYQFLQGLS